MEKSVAYKKSVYFSEFVVDDRLRKVNKSVCCGFFRFFLLCPKWGEWGSINEWVKVTGLPYLIVREC